MSSPERSTVIGALGIGAALFVAAIVAIIAGGLWAALGWVLMVVVVLGLVGAVGSRFGRR
jgi:hypothetical protein